MLKSDRDRNECERNLAKWRALQRNFERSARNFGLDPTDVSVLLDEKSEELAQQIEQFDLLRRGGVQQLFGETELTTTPFAVLQHCRLIPDSLIEARIMLGWSQKELAMRTGITQQQLNRYENTSYSKVAMDTAICLSAILQEEKSRREMSKRA